MFVYLSLLKIRLKGHSTLDFYVNSFDYSSFVFALFAFRHLYIAVFNPNMGLVHVISYVVCAV
jgi:hypothetical protein